jgi:septum formation protein
MIILATQSQTRRSLLAAAGIAFEAMASPLEEKFLHQKLSHLSPRELAIALATAKAAAVSTFKPDDLVIGLDQTFELDGQVFHKPDNKGQAVAHLAELQGKTHALHTAYSILRNQQIVAQHCNTSTLTMRSLSPQYISDYIQKVSDQVLTSVGCYQLEGRGIQLMSTVQGDYFSILGLPLLPLLTHLRELGEIPL